MMKMSTWYFVYHRVAWVTMPLTRGVQFMCTCIQSCPTLIYACLFCVTTADLFPYQKGSGRTGEYEYKYSNPCDVALQAAHKKTNRFFYHQKISQSCVLTVALQHNHRNAVMCLHLPIPIFSLPEVESTCTEFKFDHFRHVESQNQRLKHEKTT